MTLLLPPIVAAGAAVTDSLGREWDPTQHPRGRDGKFIHTFKRISGFLHGTDTEPWMTGEVTQINPDGTIRVKVTATTDPNLVDPSTGMSYVGHEVDITPDSVESLNEKAVLKKDIFGNIVAPGAGDGFNSYNFTPEGLQDFGKRAGMSQADTDDLVKGAENFKNGKAYLVGSRAKYHLGLYAKSISGDNREHSDEQFRGLLGEMGVDPEVLDDTPDGMSGVVPLAKSVNDTHSPNVNDLDNPAWFNEEPPLAEGAIRQANLRNTDIHIGWFDDGTQGFINDDGSIEKYNPNDHNGESIYMAAHEKQNTPATPVAQITDPDAPTPPPEPVDIWAGPTPTFDDLPAPPPPPEKITEDTFEPSSMYLMDFDFDDLDKNYLQLESNSDLYDFFDGHNITVEDDSDGKLLLRGTGADLQSMWEEGTNGAYGNDKFGFYNSLEASSFDEGEGPSANLDDTPEPDPWGDPPEPIPLDDLDMPDDPEPDPDTEDWESLVDEQGPYRVNAAGDKMRVGDTVVGADGSEMVITKFEKNNKGIIGVDPNDSKKKFVRHRKKLTVPPKANLDEPPAADPVPDAAPTPDPEPTPTPEADKPTPYAWDESPTPEPDDTPAPLADWEKELLGYYEEDQAAKKAAEEQAKIAPTFKDHEDELKSINDIPKTTHGVLSQFIGTGMSAYQVKQYRNAGYAMDDAALHTPGSPEWTKAINKAVANLKNSGPNGDAKREQIEALRTKVIQSSSAAPAVDAPAEVPVADVPSTLDVPELSPDYPKLQNGHVPFAQFDASGGDDPIVAAHDADDNVFFYYAGAQDVVDAKITKDKIDGAPVWSPYNPGATDTSAPVTPEPDPTPDASGKSLPENYGGVPTGSTIVGQVGNGNDVVYAVADEDGDVQFHYPDGDVVDAHLTADQIKNAPAWEDYDGGAPATPESAPAPAADPVPQPAPAAPVKTGPSRTGADGNQIYVGDTVTSTTDGKEYVVVKFENNDVGIVVRDPATGKKYARNRKKLVSKSPSAAPAESNAPKPPVNEPDPNSTWFGKDKPVKPETPDFTEGTGDWVPAGWLEEAEANWKANTTNPNKKFSETLQYARWNAVATSGDLASLNSLKSEGFISDSLYQSALDGINANADAIQANRDKHKLLSDQYAKDVSDWAKANGQSGITLQGMSGAAEMSNSKAVNWFNQNQKAGSLGPGGKFTYSARNAVSSQKSSNISGPLRAMKEKSLDDAQVYGSYNGSTYKAMDLAMQESPPLAQDFIVHRTFSSDAFVDPDTGQPFSDYTTKIHGIAGTIQRDWGYAEASPGANSGYQIGNVRMRLRVPQGTRAVWTGDTSNDFGHVGERGLIMERNLAYYIHSVTWNGSHWLVDAEVIPKSVNYDEYGNFLNENPIFN